MSLEKAKQVENVTGKAVGKNIPVEVDREVEIVPCQLPVERHDIVNDAFDSLVVHHNLQYCNHKS